MIELSVNIDHVATIRQARRAAYPDPVAAARIAEDAGARGITAHLRGDRRHVQDEDVERLRASVRGKLNVEMAATDEMLSIATRIVPDQVTLVPERPDEVTTEGGLDVVGQGKRVRHAAEVLGDAGISVSVFVDPEPRQVEALAGLGEGLVDGFEMNTDLYTKAIAEERAPWVEQMRRTAEHGHGLGFAIYAGHGLTTDNVGPVAGLPHVSELNIGHFLVGRAVMVGMGEAVKEMLRAMGSAR